MIWGGFEAFGVYLRGCTGGFWDAGGVSLWGGYGFGAHQALFGADERAVLAVEAVVEPAGVAQVMPGAVPAPQRRCRRSAVDALTGLCPV